MPPVDNSKTEKLDQLMELLNSGVSKEEFESSVDEILQHVIQTEQALANEVERLSTMLQAITEKIKTDTSTALSDITGKVDHVFVGERLSKMEQAHNQKLAEIDQKLSTIRNGKDGRDSVPEDVAIMVQGMLRMPKDGSPDTPEEVRNKLEFLKGEERLDVSAVKGIKEYVRNSVIMPSGGGGSLGGNVVRAHDLSASLDGVTRTFALPAFWRIISVHLSSFPSILRPTVDYTEDASAMTITFTSQVPDSSISAGQTLIITYATTV